MNDSNKQYNNTITLLIIWKKTALKKVYTDFFIIKQMHLIIL